MINAGILTGNLGYRRAGVANYVHHLTSDLSGMVDVTSICHRSGKEYPGTHRLIPNYPPIAFNTILWSYAVSLQRKKLQNLDIVHNPSQYPLPFQCHKRYLMTILDITAITFPKYHTLYRTLYSKAYLKKNIIQASHIISISEKTKSDLISYFSTPSEKISVIYLAASDNFHPARDYEIINIRKKYNLFNPYILFVGTIEPRKNIPGLLIAFKELITKYPEYELIIVGRKGWKYKEVYQIIRQLVLEKHIKFLEYVSHEDLPAIYSGSQLFVLPSWYEGFGLPPLEAMQCGVPVIVSDRGSLPEIVGPEGCTVSPDNPHELMEAMERFLKDDADRKSQIKYNIDRTKQFNWKRCALETVEIYNMVTE